MILITHNVPFFEESKYKKGQIYISAYEFLVFSIYLGLGIVMKLRLLKGISKECPSHMNHKTQTTNMLLMKKKNKMKK